MCWTNRVSCSACRSSDFLSDDQETFERLIKLPDGILLVTGPTGSGKTSTLYACLNYINKPDRKIITVEEPVEYQMTGINQVQVNADIGMTFPAALRSILRQAPNIIMIGEIRDLETASIATNACLTGHLVFSTLHTNDAPSAVARLVDIGVQPFLVASSVRAIMAQRLVRRLCTNCKQPGELSETEMRALRIEPGQMSDAQVMKPVGCEQCRQTGYKGRMGIFEIFIIDDEVAAHDQQAQLDPAPAPARARTGHAHLARRWRPQSPRRPDLRRRSDLNHDRRRQLIAIQRPEFDERQSKSPNFSSSNTCSSRRRLDDVLHEAHLNGKTIAQAMVDSGFVDRTQLLPDHRRCARHRISSISVESEIRARSSED